MESLGLAGNQVRKEPWEVGQPVMEIEGRETWGRSCRRLTGQGRGLGRLAMGAHCPPGGSSYIELLNPQVVSVCHINLSTSRNSLRLYVDKQCP